MKPRVISIVASTIMAASLLFPATSNAAAVRASTPTMSVKIVSVTPTTVTGKKAGVTFRLLVKGMVLDAVHMGKANVRGHGHIQLYVDKIAVDAYVKKDLKHNWLASLAATTISLNLPPMLIGGAGKHKIIVALAQNNYILYRVPTAAVTITAK
jgi:hypothetical protein